MDFKTLSKFIIILGIVILVYGCIRFGITLQPSKRTLNDNYGRVLEEWDQAQINEVKRASAIKIIVAGAVVLFLGIGIYASVKKPQPPRQQQEQFDRDDALLKKYQEMTNGELKGIVDAPPGFYTEMEVRTARWVLQSR